MTPTIPETLHWRAVADELPDDEYTVLMYSPEADEPVWLGYYRAEFWHDADDGMPRTPGSVTHWAEMPTGPQR